VTGRRRFGRGSARLARDAASIALTAPQVVAHRLARMALASRAVDPRDAHEFVRMGTEKVAAFHESWCAMLFETWRIQQEMGIAALSAMWRPWPPFQLLQARAMQRAATRLIAAGIAPVRKRTVANARRLGSAKRRRS
jgi:hypothetical protein